MPLVFFQNFLHTPALLFRHHSQDNPDGRPICESQLPVHRNRAANSHFDRPTLAPTNKLLNLRFSLHTWLHTGFWYKSLPVHALVTGTPFFPTGIILMNCQIIISFIVQPFHFIQISLLCNSNGDIHSPTPFLKRKSYFPFPALSVLSECWFPADSPTPKILCIRKSTDSSCCFYLYRRQNILLE